MLHALGLSPRRVHQTGSAVVHCQWPRDGWGGEEGREEASKKDFSAVPDSRSALISVSDISDLEHQSTPTRLEALFHDVLRVGSVRAKMCD